MKCPYRPITTTTDNSTTIEFAEKLKQQAFECDIYHRFGKEHFAKAVAVVDIDRLAEEMTEGGK